MIALTLPWPHRGLSPNSRVHWAAKSKLTRSHRRTAAVLCLEAMTGANWAAPLLPKVSVTFHPADKRRRDLDNCISSMKAYHDGIADALYRNDANFMLAFQMGEPRKPACVQVEIS